MRGRFVAVKGDVISEVVTPVSWCTGAWQINSDSSSLASDESLQPLYQLITREVKLGQVVRQELVSMIPAILLDCHRKHCILDLCAAPGSKTEQLLSVFPHKPLLSDTDEGNILQSVVFPY
jgi:16S rRNA C967 or C1407 C5-methylase (RsmB/RsmF family)